MSDYIGKGPPGTEGGGGNQTEGGPGGGTPIPWWKKLLMPIGANKLGTLGSILGGAGAGLGAYSAGQAANRDAEFSGQMDLEHTQLMRERQLQDMQIAREAEGRASGTDAWKKLLASQRVLEPGPRPQLSQYSVKPRTATEAERTGADAMSAEVMRRLQGGNQIPEVTQHELEVDRNLLKAGGGEKTTGILAAILAGLGRR